MFQAKGFYRTTWGGCAAANLMHQLPFFVADIPELVNYHRGTINVRFQPRIIVAGSDYRTPPVSWDKQTPEVFDFVKVRLSFAGVPGNYSAYLYAAHRSDHRLDPHKQEFICERQVVGLRESMEVTMTCDRKYIELPYEAKANGGGGSNEPRLARTFVIL